MKNPVISIIIPVYNCEEYIEACLDSIINQNCDVNLFDVILIDDQSPCNASQIVKDKYLDKYQNIKLIESQEKIGPGGARNRGIKEAATDLITFIDGDDWYTNEFYDSLLKEHLNNDSDITVAGMINTVDGKNVRWNAIPPLGTYSGSEKLNLLWDVNVECHSPYRIYNKSLFTEKEVWFKENAFYEDTAIMPELFDKANQITCLNKVVYNYRFNQTSIVNTSSNKHITDINNSVHHLLEIVPINQKAVRFIWWLYNHNIFKKRWDYLSQVNLEEFKEFMDGFVANMKEFPFMIYQSQELQDRKEIEETMEKLDNSYGTSYSNQFNETIQSEIGKEPLVSVIMPNYNNAEYIKESIISVLNQSYTNIELIVVDDCSTDHSVKEIKKITDHRLKIIELEKNSRTYFARNTGIKNAQGSIITNVDSDDIIAKNRVENVVKFFQENPSLKLVETRFIRYFGDSNLIEPRKFTQGVPHGFYRREVFKEIGYFHPIKSGGDSEFSERTITYYGASFYKIIDDFTFFCKILPTSLTAVNPQGSKSREEYIEFYRNLHRSSFNQLKCNFPWQNVEQFNHLELFHFADYPNSLKLNSTGESVFTPDEDLKRIESLLLDLQVQTLNYFYKENSRKELELTKIKKSIEEDQEQVIIENPKTENERNFYVDENKDIKDHYNKVYEDMPNWWKKTGGLIRKLKGK